MKPTSKRKAIKTKNIVIRCSPEEHDKIAANAQLNNLTITQYVLKMTLPQYEMPVADEKVIKVLLKVKADLARLGNLFKMYVQRGDYYSNEFKATLLNIKKITGDFSTYFSNYLVKKNK